MSIPSNRSDPQQADDKPSSGKGKPKGDPSKSVGNPSNIGHQGRPSAKQPGNIQRPDPKRDNPKGTHH
jgi:hypothetical protein